LRLVVNPMQVFKKRSCQEVCKKSSGGRPLRKFPGPQSIDVPRSVVDAVQQLRGSESAKSSLCDHQHLADDRGSVAHLLEPLRRVGPLAQGGEGGYNRVARAQVRPVRLRELVERDHPVPVVRERLDGLRMARIVDPGELVPELLALGLRLGVGVTGVYHRN